jgi:hypothetical protein
MIPAIVTTELADLQTQVAAAAPLTSASRATVTALQLNAAQLIADIDAAVVTTAGQLDSWVATTEPNAIVAGVISLLTSATDQSALANMRGYVGRSTSNLDQI